MFYDFWMLVQSIYLNRIGRLLFLSLINQMDEFIRDLSMGLETQGIFLLLETYLFLPFHKFNLYKLQNKKFYFIVYLLYSSQSTEPILKIPLFSVEKVS